MRLHPDLATLAATLAAESGGTTEILGTDQLRYSYDAGDGNPVGWVYVIRNPGTESWLVVDTSGAEDFLRYVADPMSAWG